MHFTQIEELDHALSAFARVPLPFVAGFLAGKCFLAYKKRGGLRRSPMADFYIGAHAAIEQMQLLTRDAARYRTYFFPHADPARSITTRRTGWMACAC